MDGEVESRRKLAKARQDRNDFSFEEFDSRVYKRTLLQRFARCHKDLCQPETLGLELQHSISLESSRDLFPSLEARAISFVPRAMFKSSVVHCSGLAEEIVRVYHRTRPICSEELPTTPPHGLLRTPAA
jgi:hypothetical protein